MFYWINLLDSSYFQEMYNNNFRIAKKQRIFQMLSIVNKNIMSRLYIYFLNHIRHLYAINKT